MPRTITSTTAPTLSVSVRDITNFGFKIDFEADQETLIYYYLIPEYEYQVFSAGQLESWIKQGIIKINDLYINYGVINDPLIKVTHTYTEMMSDTTYKLKIWEIPIKFEPNLCVL